MTLWTIIPRDPLIFRDGKPFTAAPGARASSLPFPYPSTIVGAVRTIAGTNPETGKFDTNRIPELLRKQITGPVLGELGEEGITYLFPAPADALLLKTNAKEMAMCQWVRPIETPQDALTDLEEMSLLGPKKIIKEKPHSKQPRFWREDEYFKWLVNPVDGLIKDLSKLGHHGPQTESRTHVSINPKTHTAAPGALFQTSGLEYCHTEEQDSDDEYIKLTNAKTLVMVVKTDASLRNGLGFLGGERRMAQWRQAEEDFPACPHNIRETIKDHGACRLVLLTPAYFSDGYLPTWLRTQYSLEIKAVATARYQSVSGWDYENNQEKPTRRLVPAGSVYFVKFPGAKRKEDIEKFINEIWMQTISDDEQNRLDGFGLAVLGTWDGDLKDMEVES